MAAAYPSQRASRCITPGQFHVNLTVTNSFSLEMCVRVSHATVTSSWPPSAGCSGRQSHSRLRVCFALVVKMFTNPHQVLVYIVEPLPPAHYPPPLKQALRSRLCPCKLSPGMLRGAFHLTEIQPTISRPWAGLSAEERNQE